MGWGGEGKGAPKWDYKVMNPECTVWLGSLPEGVTHTELLPLMRTVGSCKRVQVGTRGSGFAIFTTPEEAQAAIEQLNGSDVSGTSIQVDTYTQKEKTGGAGGGKGSWGKQQQQQPYQAPQGVWKPQFQKQEGGWSNGGNSWGGNNGGNWSKGGDSWGGKGKSDFRVQHPERTVWIGNIAEGVTHQDLMPLFKTVGDCKRVQVGRKGTGFAFFGDAASAQAAIETLNGSVVSGQEIQVDEYTPKPKS